MYADREDPAWALEWRDSAGALFNFSTGWDLRLELITRRTHRIGLTKTTGIVGSATTPNVVVTWGVGELADKVGRWYVRLVARNVVTGAERVFREDSLPMLTIMKPPVAP
jgi:hypothetical protein